MAVAARQQKQRGDGKDDKKGTDMKSNSKGKDNAKEIEYFAVSATCARPLVT